MCGETARRGVRAVPSACARLCSTGSVPPAPAQIRISSQHLQSGQFSGQQVRAVGKLVSHNGDSVQLQLAGEGEPSDARAHATQPCANTHAEADEMLLPSSAGPAATVHCSHDRSWEDKNDQVDKGFFEVIGTLQADGSIVSMTSVAMGDNLGAPARPPVQPRDPLPIASPFGPSGQPAGSTPARPPSPRPTFPRVSQDLLSRSSSALPHRNHTSATQHRNVWVEVGCALFFLLA